MSTRKFTDFVETDTAEITFPLLLTDKLVIVRSGVAYHVAAVATFPTYQRIIPLTGDILETAEGLGALVLVPAAQIATLVVTVPPNPSDGQVFEMSTTQTIVAFSLLSVDATISEPDPGTLGANSKMSLRYVEEDTTWY